MLREIRVRTLIGLAFAAWTPGLAAFAIAHPTWSERAVLSNALGDAEQQALWTVLALGLVLVLAAGAALVVRARRAGQSPIAGVERLSLGGLLIGPLALYPLYLALIPDYVVLTVVAAMAFGFAYALSLVSGERALPGGPPALHRAAPWALGAFAVVHTIVLSDFAHAEYRSFSNGWDLAIYNQVHWNIVHSGVPWSTMYSATDSENHYSIHFSPIYHLTALAYALKQSPETLTTLQNAALATGALPLFLLAQHKTRSTWIALCLALSYLFNPALHSIGVYEFHEVAFFVPLVLALAWAIETGRTRAFWVFVVLTLLVREDTPMYLAFFALYLWLGGERAVAKRLAVISISYLVLTHAVFMPALRHGRLFPFYDRFLDLQRGDHKGAGAILSTLLTNPAFCIKYVIGSTDKLAFVALVALPVALLPPKSGRALLLLAPGLFFSLMSSFAPQYSIWAHYTAPFLGFLYYAAVIGLERLAPRARIPLATAALLAATLLSGKYGRYTWLNPTFVHTSLEGMRARYGDDAPKLLAVADSVPPGDSVRATNNLLPAVSGHRFAFILPGGPDADWAFVDYRPDGAHSPATFEQVRTMLREMLTSDRYGVVYRDARVVVLRKGADAKGNARALDAIEETAAH